MQIVQELCKRPGLNKCGFDMPTIYIPNPNKVRAQLPQAYTLGPFNPFFFITLLFSSVLPSSAKSLREPD